MTWKRKNGRDIKPSRYPGVFNVKGEKDKFFIRRRVKDPRTGKLKELSKLVKAASAKDAHEFLENRVKELQEGITQKALPNFGDYADDLLKRKLTRGTIKSAAGEQKWNSILKHHLKPAFGDFYLDKLTRKDIEAWLDKQAKEVQEGAYSPNSVNSWFRVLRTIFNDAAAEYDFKNPITNIKPLPTTGHRTYTIENPNSIPADKIKEFLETLKKLYPGHYAFAYLGFLTGARPSSLRPLRRKGDSPDVLWDRNLVIFRRSHTIGDTVMEATKTGRDVQITLPEEAMAILKWHCESTFNIRQEKSELLFPSITGGLRSRSCLTKPFRKVAKEIGLGFTPTPKAMRRTASDLLRLTDTKLLVHKSVTGHATDAMVEHYSTVDGAEQQEALAKVIDLFSGQEKQVG